MVRPGPRIKASNQGQIPKAKYRNVAQGVADSVSVIDQEIMEQEPRGRPPRRLGLSGKLFLLTIPLVAIASLGLGAAIGRARNPSRPTEDDATPQQGSAVENYR